MTAGRPSAATAGSVRHASRSRRRIRRAVEATVRRLRRGLGPKIASRPRATRSVRRILRSLIRARLLFPWCFRPGSLSSLISCFPFATCILRSVSPRAFVVTLLFFRNHSKSGGVLRVRRRSLRRRPLCSTGRRRSRACRRHRMSSRRWHQVPFTASVLSWRWTHSSVDSATRLVRRRSWWSRRRRQWFPSWGTPWVISCISAVDRYSRVAPWWAARVVVRITLRCTRARTAGRVVSGRRTNVSGSVEPAVPVFRPRWVARGTPVAWWSGQGLASWRSHLRTLRTLRQGMP